MYLNSSFLLTTTAGLLLGAKAYADDTSLYAETPPEDAAFVRFIGFEEAETTQFAGRNFDLREVEENAYLPVSVSKLNGVAAGAFLSVLKDQTQTKVIAEAARDKRAKVHLFLINGTDEPLDLRLADDTATIIDGTDAGLSGTRTVNPVSVSLGVYPDEGITPIAVFDVTLKRGQNVSFVADASGVQIIENTFGPVVK